MKTIVPSAISAVEMSVLSSRFIAVVAPLNKAEDLSESLVRFQEAYPSARHYPYAARVSSFERCSDDGEPPRSVGLGLLQLLQKRGIDQVLLLVVRYFGGTKLGLGRLERTYRQIAEISLKQAPFAEIIDGLEAELSLSYADFERLKRQAEREGIFPEKITFLENVHLSLRGDAKIVTSLLEALPKGSVILTKQAPILRSIPHD